MASRWRLGAPMVALVTTLACSSPAPVPSRTPLDEDHDIVANNQTTIPVTLVVNGSTVRHVLPRSQERVLTADLPPLPWRIEARTSVGRLLTSMTVRDGDVLRTSHSIQGDAMRADLSCGRLDVVVGPPLDGPPPAPGRPGDCDP